MIRFEDVRFSYPDGTEVLHGVTLEIPQGQSVALLGASGSGKTTLLHVLLGLNRPQHGRVLVDGVDIVPLAERDLIPIRRRMGVVFQDGALFDSLTVGENVSFMMRELMQLPEEEIEARTRRQLEFVELEHTLDLLPDELSGGMRRRVAVARALAGFDLEIMLYDEPTSGLDPITADTVCELIRKVAQRKHLTSIMVTHRLRDAFKVADHIVVFQDGNILYQGDRDGLFANEDPYIKRFLA
ncbi:MAG: ATP-binding cassette domain-containing protein [Nitrospirota bacterium]|nr:ATP-binding cassette domain-containing protein [Nitrospirota bacterium]